MATCPQAPPIEAIRELFDGDRANDD